MGAVCCRAKPIDFDGDVNLFHFALLRNIGKGAFGKVRVVQHKQSNELYALKYINKAKCVKMRAVSNIVQERRLLEEIDHPYIVNMRYAFQDDDNCFFVLDLMLGGDLRFHLERLGHLPEEAVRFWIAELSSALDYLHSKRIVHRDLKPDNILLDAKGHAHLTDFNIAVHLHYSTSSAPGQPPRLKPLTGVAGSMAYMAPEVLAKKGYTTTVDWWSLGVCAYELLFGKRPFRGRTNGELKMAIMKASIRVPDDAATRCSRNGQNFLRGLLTRDVTARLGCVPNGDGSSPIKSHPWLSDLDWPSLEAKILASPFAIDPKKAHFDATHDLEELLLEDNPLRARERNPKQDINKLTVEYRQMEEKFLIYDYTRMERKSYYLNGTQSMSQATQSMTASVPDRSRPATPGPDHLGDGDDENMDEVLPDDDQDGVGEDGGYELGGDPLTGHHNELKQERAAAR
ncbi:kinase-like protein [Exidia glandulosa HHB12029]|uniref:non-specific serine/threonine protein kinase n=1 Tax=Exidia glandulosa HHB12029 TaxID=1314781 RepID=A0A166AJL4_EXIGL|nr:kinase-like protein [Exidia glandulosa HHB12029]